MAIVDVGHIAAYRQTRSPSRLAWSEGQRLSDQITRVNSRSDLCHDDCTINIVPGILLLLL